MLRLAFGDCLKAELKEVDIGLVTNGYITPVIKTVVATVDGLNTDILLDTETYEALLEQERIHSPRFTAAMNLRSDSSKKSFDESVNTEEEEQEPTITEYDEENGNNTEKIKKQQQICDTLQEAWNFARRNKGGYVIENNILYHEELLGGNRIKQLVIPEMRKRKILEIAHESVFGAHLGAHKTIRSINKIPITPVSRPELPFQVVNVDLIGPVGPVPSQGHKYLLCLVDQHSRWPEAIPFKSLTAKTTCEALLEIFTPKRGQDSLLCRLDKVFKSNGIVKLEHSKRNYQYTTFSTNAWKRSERTVVYIEVNLDWEHVVTSEYEGISTELFEKAKRKFRSSNHKAKLTSDVQQGSYAKYYNRQKKHREIAPGDQVLVLIPDSTNKLYARRTGPVKVVKRVKPNSYYLQMAGGNLRLLHVNKIREYRARVQTVGVVYDIEDEFGEIYETSTVPAAEKNDEALDRVTLEYLSKKQQTELKDHLHRYRTLFSGKIKRAKVGEHVIKLKTEEETMKHKTYQIPENLKRKVDAQIDELIELGLIEPVVSEIAHPVNMMELNFLVGKKKFITVLDMLKGYWSIPMEDSSKHLTAFRTHRGQYQWNVLPFVLRNAAATYQRSISKVVQTIPDFACAYIDDLAIFSDT
ncbi:retrovirus-related Pol polyprotein from transposon 17.6 [Trichonephila clavipes]|nr:retrovirus-related Pol polyprotein from transposon 17.6 [Trichonephila clavipes]